MPRYALFSLLLLAACGGGSKSTSPTPLPLRDTTPPVITLAGVDPQVLTTGDAYSELGATATDNLDGDVTGSIVIDVSDVNTNVAGDYTVTYTVTDAAGNSSTVARTVRVENPPLPAEPHATVTGEIKKLGFSWANVDGADYYRLLENADGHSGFSQVGNDIPAGTLSVSRDIAVHLTDFVNGQFIVEACNVSGCASSDVVTATQVMLGTIGYFKASNTDWRDKFGAAIAMSSDGRTLAVGAPDEESNATGIDGDQGNNSARDAGAVYVYRFDGTNWFQQAYVKSSEPGVARAFSVVALSADGNTLVVGAPEEREEGAFPTVQAGAAYIFRFVGGAWIQQARIEGSNTESGDYFGGRVALSADGNTLVVGAYGERSNATGINGDQFNDSLICCGGAVYVFRFDGMNWFQQAYVKASNPDPFDSFSRVAISADGNTFVVGAASEDSNATGINGDQNDNSADSAGAVYVFRFDGTDWSQHDYIKASNTGAGDRFGGSVALSEDGAWMAVGAYNESSNAIGIHGDQSDNSRTWSGAVYIFHFDGTDWSQHEYIKASNTEAYDRFGRTVALDGSGAWLAVGAPEEESSSTGVNGNQNDNSANGAGAVYVFRFDGMDWSQHAYIKASNTDIGDSFGGAVALSASGETLAVGALGEDSDATGIGGDQFSDPRDSSGAKAGAVYVY